MREPSVSGRVTWGISWQETVESLLAFSDSSVAGGVEAHWRRLMLRSGPQSLRLSLKGNEVQARSQLAPVVFGWPGKHMAFEGPITDNS